MRPLDVARKFAGGNRVPKVDVNDVSGGAGIGSRRSWVDDGRGMTRRSRWVDISNMYLNFGMRSCKSLKMQY